MDALLDALDQGRFDDLGGLQELMSRVFAEFEEMFEARGYVHYEESLDPVLPNKRYAEEASHER